MPAKAGVNQLRIIGGLHRGRKLSFPSLPGLRPTGDRIRETLFNWLQPAIAGARCLDLFAGSGALGFEAASRGAGRVVMLDSAREAVRQLEHNRQLLNLRQVEVRQADALAWLDRQGEPFDLVFLDPPFADALLPEACRLLQAGGWLAAGSRIYLETDASHAFPELPKGWELIREKRAGQVRYGLAQVSPLSA